MALLQCYSSGDTRYSAKCARLAYGPLIEDIYQTSKRDAQGKQYARPKRQMPVYMCINGQLYYYSNALRHDFYNSLWFLYFLENPDLYDLACRYTGFYETQDREGKPQNVHTPESETFFSDPFAQPSSCDQSLSIAWLVYTRGQTIEQLFCKEVQDWMLAYWKQKQVDPSSSQIYLTTSLLRRPLGLEYVPIKKVGKVILAHTNILNDTSHAIVNTVNCKGVMGKGLALEFKEHLKDTNYFTHYQSFCDGRMQPGMILRWQHPKTQQIIISASTKDNWQDPSKLEWIDSILQKLAIKIPQWGITSLAMSELGCGLGGLNWDDVGPLVARHLGSLGIPIRIYINKSDSEYH